MRAKTSPSSPAARPESFQIKGGLFPMTLLEVKTDAIATIAEELTARVAESPAFFNNNPLVLGFEQLKGESHFDLHALVGLCRELGFIPAAIKGGTSELETLALSLGLATLPKGKAKGSTTLEIDKQPAPAAKTRSADVIPAPVIIPPQVIDTPVRSGQQIYTKGDLIILSSVSAGAEVLADGNIHIYGALRGRALAGVQGDESARIFCQSQEAELIAVAGQYVVDEDLRAQHWKSPIQALCANGKLVIAPLF
ncbi:MAG: septum site-determining protein MinC [Marinagarivorans sp.]